MLKPKCNFTNCTHTHIIFFSCAVACMCGWVFIGHAALLIMQKTFGIDWPLKNVRVICVGDDTSDEDVMQVSLFIHVFSCFNRFAYIFFLLTKSLFCIYFGLVGGIIAICWQGNIIPCDTKSISLFICKFQIAIS